MSEVERLLPIAQAYVRERLTGQPYHNHHLDHILRVTSLAQELGKAEGGNQPILSIAALLHDIDRPAEAESYCHAQASAHETAAWLETKECCRADATAICHAIEAHRFSCGPEPATLEARLLQDADRLDAIGAMGIVRALIHRPGTPVYHLDDPFAKARASDNHFALDHILTKLLVLKDTLHSSTAKALAEERHRFMLLFLKQFRRELE